MSPSHQSEDANNVLPGKKFVRTESERINLLISSDKSKDDQMDEFPEMTMGESVSNAGKYDHW
jgi:hypothetical protein